VPSTLNGPLSSELCSFHSSKVIELAFVHAHALRQGREVWLGVGSDYEGGRCMHVRYTLVAVTCNLHKSGNARNCSLPQKAPSSLQTRPHLPCKEPKSYPRTSPRPPPAQEHKCTHARARARAQPQSSDTCRHTATPPPAGVTSADAHVSLTHPNICLSPPSVHPQSAPGCMHRKSGTSSQVRRTA
jgi:hypothetical protein